MDKTLDELQGALDALLLLSKKARGEKIKTVTTDNKDNNLLKLPDTFNDDDFEEADSESEEELKQDVLDNNDWSEDNWKDKRVEKLRDFDSENSRIDYEDQLRKEKKAREKNKQQQHELQDQKKIKRAWFSDATPLSKLSNNKKYNDLISSFKSALAKQMEESDEEEETFYRLNPNYNSGKYRLPGIEEKEKATVPKLQMYIDLSGSLTNDDINLAKSFIAQLEIFHRQGSLNYEVYFFADTVSKSPNKHRFEHGTLAYYDILTNINKTKPDNVIIFTDSDFDYYSRIKNNKSCIDKLFYVQVPGIVWWVFCGSDLTETDKFLTGRKKTYRFKIR